MEIKYQTASQSRAYLADMELGFRRMIQGDDMTEAEIIARHYLAHVNVAQQILAIVKMSEGQPYPPDEHIKAFLKYHVDLIKTNHAHDFGIELKWK